MVCGRIDALRKCKEEDIMTVREALKKNLGKWCRVVMEGGFILNEGHATEDWIGQSAPYLDDTVVKMERGRSTTHFKQILVIIIK